MRIKRVSQAFALAVAAAVVAIQFVPSPPRTNPPEGRSIGHYVPLPLATSRLLGRACANCHSNRTHWPWYSRVAPFSWIVRSDVVNARQTMNFSEWTGDRELALGLLSAACSEMKRGYMPPARYTLVHPEARLSVKDVDEFCSWTRAQTNLLRVPAAADGSAAPLPEAAGPPRLDGR